MPPPPRRGCLPLPSRWAVLVGVIFLEAIGGSPYAFAVYAPQLQALFGWSNAAIASVGGVGNIGLYLALDAGLFYDARGPGETAVVGALLSLAGYGLLWAGASGALGGSAAAPAPPPALVTLASVLFNHGSGWLDTVAVAVAVRAFPGDRGFVVGLLKAFFGLSASLLTLSYASLFRPDAVAFLLFLAALVPGVAAAAAAALRLVPAAEAAAPLTRFERRKLAAAAGALAALAGYVALVGVLQSRGALGAQPFLAALLLPLLLAQTLLAWPEKGCSGAGGGGGGGGGGEGEGGGAEALLAPEEGAVAMPSGAEEEEDDEDALPASARKRSRAAASAAAAAAPEPAALGASFVSAVLSLDMLLICLVLFAGTGAGLTLINNLGALTRSLGASKDGQDVFVILLSVANCLGRLLVGLLSDKLARRVPRPVFFLGSVLAMAAAQLVLAFADLSNGLLFVGVLLAGAAYGAFWSTGPSLVADRFGVRSFASLYNVVSLWTALASFLFSSQMAPFFYARRAAGAAECAGAECFRDTFLVLAGACAAAAAAAALLAARLRDLYATESGAPRPYAEWARRNAAQATSAPARAAARACMPLCCCACGRALLLDDEDAGAAAGGAAFEGDVSMAFLGDDEGASRSSRFASVASAR